MEPVAHHPEADARDAEPGRAEVHVLHSSHATRRAAFDADGSMRVRWGERMETDRQQRQDEPYVSTGRLPPEDDVRALVDEAHRRYRDVDAGVVSDVYPALTRVAPGLFGVCVTAVDGRVHAVGDADVGFTIMSVAKPFTFALVCDELGADEVQHRVGVNATGLPFNSLEAVEQREDARTNPMVNPGAIATASFAPGETVDEKWRFVTHGLARFAGRPLELDDEVYESASVDQPPQPRARPAPREPGRDPMRPRRCGRPLHEAELSQGERPRPGGDGRDPRRRRRQPAHRRARRRGGHVPVRPRRDDDRRAVRDVGRLAVRRGPAGEERDRRRHRHGLAGQGRPRHVLAAARRGGEQRPRASSPRGSSPAGSVSTCSRRRRSGRRTAWPSSARCAGHRWRCAAASASRRSPTPAGDRRSRCGRGRRRRAPPPRARRRP